MKITIDMDMRATNMSQPLLVLGALLFLVGLLQGAVVDVFHSPRLALSAHIAAVQNGMVLMIYGLLWSRLSLTTPLERVTQVSAIAGMYLIWLGFTLAATTGASRVLKFSGAGFSASQPFELATGALIYAGAGASIVAAFLVLLGLVRNRPGP